MGEMKDVTLKSLLAGMKNGEGLAFVANDQLGVVDVYSGIVQGCSYHFGDGNKTFSMNLAAVNCALTISQKSLKDELTAQTIAMASKTIEHFNTKSLLELAKKAVEAQKKMAQQTPEEIDAWAQKLGNELAAAGESEYGPGYNKDAQEKVCYVPQLGMNVISSMMVKPGDIFVVSSSIMSQPGKFDIVALGDMQVSNNPTIANYYGTMLHQDAEFKSMIQGDYDGNDDPGLWMSDVTSAPGSPTLTKVLLEQGMKELMAQKPKPDFPGFYSEAAKLCGEPLIKPQKNVLPAPPFGQWDETKLFLDNVAGNLQAKAYIDAQPESTLVKVVHDGGIYICLKHGAKLAFKQAIAEELGSAVADQVADEKAFYAESNQKELATLKKNVDSNVVANLDAAANIAFKVDAMAQQQAEAKIKSIEQKLQKINQNHPMAKKIQAELLALKMKLIEMKAKPIQMFEGPLKLTTVEGNIIDAFEMFGLGAASGVVLGQPDGSYTVRAKVKDVVKWDEVSLTKWIQKLGLKLGPAKVTKTGATEPSVVEFNLTPLLPTILDVDAADYIKDAFEQAGIGVVKVKVAGHSALATIVIEKESITPVELIDKKLHAVGWSRVNKGIHYGGFTVIEKNENGSQVVQFDLLRKIKPAEIAKALGADVVQPAYTLHPTIYASASTATTGPVYVDMAKPGAEVTALVFQASDNKAIMLKPDGQVIIPEGMTLDEASLKFWDAIATSNPMRGEVNRLIEKLAVMNTLHENLAKRLQRYEGDPSRPAPEDPREARFGNIANNL